MFFFHTVKDCTILVYGVFDEDHMRKEITNRGGRVFLEDDEIAVEDLTHLVTDRPWEVLFGFLFSDIYFLFRKYSLLCFKKTQSAKL